MVEKCSLSYLLRAGVCVFINCSYKFCFSFQRRTTKFVDSYLRSVAAKASAEIKSITEKQTAKFTLFEVCLFVCLFVHSFDSLFKPFVCCTSHY